MTDTHTRRHQDGLETHALLDGGVWKIELWRNGALVDVKIAPHAKPNLAGIEKELLKNVGHVCTEKCGRPLR